MPNKCEITGKKTGNGNKRSHSKIATKRKFKVNLQKKKLINPATGEKMTLNISTKAIKTLKKWDKEGKVYDLEVLISK